PSFWAEFDTFFDCLPSKLRYGRNRFFNSGNAALEVAVISGAALCVRRTVLDCVGAFDKDFFMYFEDTELCHRISAAGWKLVNLPAAKIVHLGGASTGSLAVHALKTESWKLYLSKTKSASCASFLLFCRKVTIYTRIAVHCFNPRLRSKWQSYRKELQ
ncbi:MAG: glycosyltransferase, partial [Bacteroidales bacterium]|nr:glycosyltransferase [Bacteroidales bacterium]